MTTRGSGRTGEPRDRDVDRRDVDRRDTDRGRDTDRRRATDRDAGRDMTGLRRQDRRAPGVPEIGPLGPRRTGAGGTGRGGISEARAYTPRGRTVRETGPDRPSDPHRPALRLIDHGGPADPVAPGARTTRFGSRRTESGRTESGRTDSARVDSARADGRPADGGRAGADRSGTAPARSGSAGVDRIATRDVSRGRTGGRTDARTPGRPRSAGGGRGGGGTGGGRGPGGPDRWVPRARRVLPPLRRFEPGRRLRFGTAVLLLVFVTLGGRLVQLQLTDGRAYAAAGLKDRLTTAVLAAPRGSIVDRYGNVLAQSVDARYVFADPTRVVDPAGTALKLRDLLAVPVSQLVPLLTHKTNADGSTNEFEYLARGVSPQIGDAVTALKLAGIGVAPDQRRDVPGHDLAANIIGFTGTDMTGLAGIEGEYNSQLEGVPGSHTYEVGDGTLGAQLPGGYDESKPARPGSTVQLTIDRDLQYEIQQMLFDHMTAAKADFGAAVVMDVHTGEVLAQASYPTFDAANWQQYTPDERMDAATQVTVEPGSVAKVVTISGALQDGIITPNSLVPIGPTIYKGGQPFSDTHPFPAGTKITIPGILAFSSNVGTITVASELGADELYKYQKLLGFGSSTDEGIPGESDGLVQPPKNWSGSSYGSIPIGLGISVTPLQMTAAYAAIANNGVWVQPHLVKAIITPDGRSHPTPPAATHVAVSPQVAQEVRTVFEAVTTVPDATGRSGAVTGYLVSGKTGTGLQVKNGVYISGQVASFVAMAPADNPRYVIGVFAHVPVGTGGAVAGPTFHDMMTFTLQHFQVPPTGAKAPKFRVTGK